MDTNSMKTNFCTRDQNAYGISKALATCILKVHRDYVSFLHLFVHRVCLLVFVIKQTNKCLCCTHQKTDIRYKGFESTSSLARTIWLSWSSRGRPIKATVALDSMKGAAKCEWVSKCMCAHAFVCVRAHATHTCANARHSNTYTGFQGLSNTVVVWSACVCLMFMREHKHKGKRIFELCDLHSTRIDCRPPQSLPSHVTQAGHPSYVKASHFLFSCQLSSVTICCSQVQRAYQAPSFGKTCSCFGAQCGSPMRSLRGESTPCAGTRLARRIQNMLL